MSADFNGKNGTEVALLIPSILLVHEKEPEPNLLYLAESGVGK